MHQCALCVGGDQHLGALLVSKLLGRLRMGPVGVNREVEQDRAK
jgi:hypothetical protein